MVWIAVGLFLFALLSSVSQAQEGTRLALVIGNQGYSAKVGPLKNPHNDVNLIEASLKQLGFKVTVLKDAGYKAMDIALKRYVTEVRRAGRGSISFFFYSGHGVANPETQLNYLIPVDVADAEDDKVWFKSFQQNTIIDLLSKQAPNATHYVVFDACRNELNMAGTAAKALGTDKGFVPITDTAGLLIAYATAPRKTASDVGDDGGPYAKALAEELMKPGIEAVTMFRNVQLRVKETIGQDPWLSFPSLPAVYFAGSKPLENVELTFWTSVRDSANPTLVNTYLKRYPNGEFAPIARVMIEHLERQLQAEQAAREEERKRQEELRKSAEVKRLEEETRRREAALGRERQRAEEIKDFAEAKRVEEQQRAEIVARSEELRKALEEVRVARKAAAEAEEQRLAALKAAEETQERLKTVGLPPSPLSPQIARDPEALARVLQVELARVGCNPGAVDGRWGAKAIEALRQFSRHAKVSLPVDEPTEDALRAIAAIKHPVCILKCAAHQKVSGGRCVPVAKSEPPAAKAEGSGKLCWPGYAPWGPRACTGDPRERPAN